MSNIDQLLILYENDYNTIKFAFGDSLKKLRNHTKTTQQTLAEETLISRQSLSVYERGEIEPTISQALKIANFFELSIDDFIIYGAGAQKEILDEDFSDIIEKYEAVKLGWT